VTTKDQSDTYLVFSGVFESVNPIPKKLTTLLHPLQGIDTIFVTSRFTGKPVTCVVCIRGGGGVMGRTSYTQSCRSVIGCLFSIRILWTNIRCVYFMAIRLICLNVFRICKGGSFNFVSSSFIDGMRGVALAHAASTMSGVVFHPLVLIL
jgi:hypothetical protein